MKVTGVVCNECKDFIYSRARHDYHSCSCGNSFIDGGRDYIRCGWTEGKSPKMAKMDVGATASILAQDYYKDLDNFGVMKESEYKGLLEFLPPQNSYSFEDEENKKRTNELIHKERLIQKQRQVDDLLEEISEKGFDLARLKEELKELKNG